MGAEMGDKEMSGRVAPTRRFGVINLEHSCRMLSRVHAAVQALSRDGPARDASLMHRGACVQRTKSTHSAAAAVDRPLANPLPELGNGFASLGFRV